MAIDLSISRRRPTLNIRSGRRALALSAALTAVFAAGLGARQAQADSGVYAVTPSAPIYWSDSNQMTVQTPTNWFVQLTGAPTVDGNSLASVQQEKASFRAAAKNAGINYKERYSFDTLWNGLSVTVSRGQVSRLSTIPGVKAIYPVGVESLPPTQQVTNPSDAFSLPMIGADVAQSELGYTGKGVKVGIIDTGIDYMHPDLGGCTAIGSGCRTAYGTDLVGDAYDANPADATYNPTPAPDPDPMDCAGHGTHVAGIIGANDANSGSGVVGVAPDVTFGAYRVFGCNGSTNDDVILQALQDAYANGMQIISMSLGDSFESWPQYPTAAASSTLVNHGVVVVAAAGNDGTSGTFATSAPAVGNKVISVASYDNTKLTLDKFTVNGTGYGYIPATGAATTPTTGSAPIVTVSPAIGCTALTPGSLAGKIALIQRGTCTFNSKAVNAQAAGAVGVVIYNNSPGFVNATVVGATPITIPVVGVSDLEGHDLVSAISAGPATLTWTDQQGAFTNPTGGLVSSFSSYGLAADLSVKPDVGAPGGFIKSTWPTWMGSYATLSGTSMATPHVTGAVALLLQARPHTPANAVRDILQNTASPKNWAGNAGLGILDDVQHQGAGMIQIDKAIQATTAVSPGKLSLGASAAGPSTNTLTITNNGSSPVTYSLSDTPAIVTYGNEFAPNFAYDPANVAFSSSTVTVPAGGSASVNVTISPASDLPAGSIYDGYLTFTPQGGGQVYHVPYAGYAGDYEALPYLTRPTYLTDLDANSAFSAGHAFTFQGSDFPAILVHFNHAPQLVQATVLDAKTGRDFHVAFSAPYQPRNSTSGGYYGYGWDGTTSNGKQVTTVPNGQYVLKLTVVKALGDASVPADVETWTSPTFTVARASTP